MRIDFSRATPRIARLQPLAQHIIQKCPSQFEEIETLHELTVSDMSGIPPNLLMKLPHLRKIRASFCYMASLPATIVSLRQLVKLELPSNRLSTLPPELTCPLEQLDLSDNRFTEIPPCVVNMTGTLMVLNMKINSITFLPAFVWSLHVLSILDLRQNDINLISPNIPNSCNLTVLKLDHNPFLRHIPAELWRVRGLRSITYEHTNVQVVPGELRVIPRLTPTPPHFGRLQWHPRWHMRFFPLGFREMVVAFMACNDRFVMPNLPTDMICAILECLDRETVLALEHG